MLSQYRLFRRTDSRAQNEGKRVEVDCIERADGRILRTGDRGENSELKGLKSGLHRIAINAWDSSGTLMQSAGTVRVPERIEACNEYKPVPSVTICSPQTANSVAGGPFHFVSAARSNAGPISSMIVYADGQEVFRTYGNYADAQLNLAAGAHQLIVNAWDSSGALMQATQSITVK